MQGRSKMYQHPKHGTGGTVHYLHRTPNSHGRPLIFLLEEHCARHRIPKLQSGKLESPVHLLSHRKWCDPKLCWADVSRSTFGSEVFDKLPTPTCNCVIVVRAYIGAREGRQMPDVRVGEAHVAEASWDSLASTCLLIEPLEAP